MKKGIRTIIGMGAISLSLIMSVFAVANLGTEEANPPEDEGYMLREYLGKVGVFLPGETEPLRMTDIETKNLPGADREELKEGIFTKNSKELAELLEDLGS
ncbi:MAG: hypothetical protein AB7D36_12045 [Oscillospiraceae bacterium]